MESFLEKYIMNYVNPSKKERHKFRIKEGNCPFHDYGKDESCECRIYWTELEFASPIGLEEDHDPKDCPACLN